MANSKQQINQAAKCIQYHLQVEKKDFKLKDIKDIIKDQNLLDITKLKKLVEDNVDKDEKEEVSVNRKQIIEDFMKDNWQLIRDNNIIKNVLLSSYCQGRLTKEQRNTIKEGLLNRCGDTNEDEDVPGDIEQKEENLEKELLGDSGEYDF